MLDATPKDWKHIEWYKIKVNDDKELQVDNWEQVMVHFKNWLGRL